MTEDLSKTICRSCLDPIRKKKYPLTGQIINVDIDVVSMLEFCTSSKMDLSDDLPNSVCVSCFKTIRIAYSFLKQFYEAQTRLVEYRNSIEENNVEQTENCIITESDSSTSQDFQNSQNFIEDNIKIEETVNFVLTDDTIEEIDRFDLSEYEDTIKEEYVEDMELVKDENPDFVQLLNLGDTELDQTNIEVVVDDEPKIDKGERVFRYICPICDKKFWRVETFYAHVASYNLSKIKCTRCNLQPEIDIKEYFQHYIDYHKFHCDICDKVMSSSYGYHYHMKHHINVRKFKCPMEGCTRSFLMNHLLKKHIKYHTLKNTYSCKFCDARFNTNDSLRYHIKLHIGKKDHLCTMCGQAFYQAVHLRDHMYRHMGFKKFVCDICGKGFTTNGSLKKHIQYCTRKHSTESSEPIQI